MHQLQENDADTMSTIVLDAAVSENPVLAGQAVKSLHWSWQMLGRNCYPTNTHT
jgi:hypothetical protein